MSHEPSPCTVRTTPGNQCVPTTPTVDARCLAWTRIPAQTGAGGGIGAHLGPGSETNASLGASIERVTLGRIGVGDAAAEEALAGDNGVLAASGGGVGGGVAGGAAGGVGGGVGGIEGE